MKHVMFGITAIAIVIMMALILSTIEGGTTRGNEVGDSLHAVLKDSLSDVMERREYSVSDNDEFVADLTAQMMRQLNTNDKNLKLEIDVAGVDASKGLMAVHVKEHFTYPNGRRGTAQDSACIVLEREKERKIYQVSYNLDEAYAKKLHVLRSYRTYRITEGKKIKVPDKVYGKKVKYWQPEGSETKINPKDLKKKTVSSPASYVAVF